MNHVANDLLRCGQIMGLASTINEAALRDHLASDQCGEDFRYGQFLEIIFAMKAATLGHKVTITIEPE